MVDTSPTVCTPRNPPRPPLPSRRIRLHTTRLQYPSTRRGFRRALRHPPATCSPNPPPGPRAPQVGPFCVYFLSWAPNLGSAFSGGLSVPTCSVASCPQLLRLVRLTGLPLSLHCVQAVGRGVSPAAQAPSGVWAAKVHTRPSPSGRSSACASQRSRTKASLPRFRPVWFVSSEWRGPACPRGPVPWLQQVTPQLLAQR